jgi:hypothetical protein
MCEISRRHRSHRVIIVYSHLISTRNHELDPTFVSVDRIQSWKFHIILERGEQEIMIATD